MLPNSSLYDILSITPKGSENGVIQVTETEVGLCKDSQTIKVSLETWYDGKVAVISLIERDYEETGCTKSCTETFADIPRSVRGSVIAVFLYRLPNDPKTHVSIRARAPYSACALAQVFGGGGHEMAAGCTIPAAPSRAKELLLAVVDEVMK